MMTAYEFKWNPTKKAKISKSFLQAYPVAEIKTINRENYFEWLEAPNPEPPNLRFLEKKI